MIASYLSEFIVKFFFLGNLEGEKNFAYSNGDNSHAAIRGLHSGFITAL
jgi:hypothetical protein